jgi:RHS repeat-associated protein
MKRLLALALVVTLVLSPLTAAAQVVEYYHTDALGSVRAITNAAGAVIERHDYLPFGEECTTGPCASNPGVGAGQPRKFTGKERDAETSLDYVSARYLAPRLGRFTTKDPVIDPAAFRDPQRWNRYGYVRNNPMRFTDPDGRLAVSPIPIQVSAPAKTAVTACLAGGPVCIAIAVGATVVTVVLIHEHNVNDGYERQRREIAKENERILREQDERTLREQEEEGAADLQPQAGGAGGRGPKFPRNHQYYKTLEEAREQRRNVDEAQELDRLDGKDRINSTGKSNQSEKNQLGKLKSIEDLPKEDPQE